MQLIYNIYLLTSKKKICTNYINNITIDIFTARDINMSHFTPIPKWIPNENGHTGAPYNNFSLYILRQQWSARMVL